MPASAQSLRITEAYRAHLQALTQVAQTEARTAWAKLEWDDLKGSYVAVGDRVEVVIRRAQTDGVRVTAAYLAAYLTSELGEPVAVPQIRSADYVGKAFAGGPLRESLDTPLFSVLRAIKDRKPDPMGRGASTLRVNVDLDVKAAPRQALLDAIAADDRFVGWVRAVRGTCAACAEKADSEPSGEVHFEVHPDCQCVTEPAVKFTEPKPGDPLTASEKDALGRWVSPQTYRNYQRLLRDPRLLAEDPAQYGEYPKLTQDLTHAIAKGPGYTPADAPVYRVTGVDHIPAELQAKLDAGEVITITDRGFLATAGDVKTAIDIGYFQTGRDAERRVLLNVRAERSLSALRTGGPSSKETLFQPGRTMKLRALPPEQWADAYGEPIETWEASIA